MRGTAFYLCLRSSVYRVFAMRDFPNDDWPIALRLAGSNIKSITQLPSINTLKDALKTTAASLGKPTATLILSV